MARVFMICMVLVCLVLPGITAAGNLTDNGNGTVTDSGTQLVWQQEKSSQMTWEVALTYCEGLTLAGYNDWRLPNHKELLSLVDDTKTNPSINTTMFPNAASSAHWSSTTSAANSSNAWDVAFDAGHFSNINAKADSYYARCVRGGQ